MAEINNTKKYIEEKLNKLTIAASKTTNLMAHTTRRFEGYRNKLDTMNPSDKDYLKTMKAMIEQNNQRIKYYDELKSLKTKIDMALDLIEEYSQEDIKKKNKIKESKIAQIKNTIKLNKKNEIRERFINTINIYTSYMGDENANQTDMVISNYLLDIEETIFEMKNEDITINPYAKFIKDIEENKDKLTILDFGKTDERTNKEILNRIITLLKDGDVKYELEKGIDQQ